MWFDADGEVVDWDGNPILLDYSIEEGKNKSLLLLYVHIIPNISGIVTFLYQSSK